MKREISFNEKEEQKILSAMKESFMALQLLGPVAVDKLRLALDSAEGKDAAVVAEKVLDRIGLAPKKDGSSHTAEELSRITSAAISSALQGAAKLLGGDQHMAAGRIGSWPQGNVKDLKDLEDLRGPLKIINSPGSPDEDEDMQRENTGPSEGEEEVSSPPSALEAYLRGRKE